MAVCCTGSSLLFNIGMPVSLNKRQRGSKDRLRILAAKGEQIVSLKFRERPAVVQMCVLMNLHSNVKRFRLMLITTRSHKEACHRICDVASRHHVFTLTHLDAQRRLPPVHLRSVSGGGQTRWAAVNGCCCWTHSFLQKLYPTELLLMATCISVNLFSNKLHNQAEQITSFMFSIWKLRDPAS